MDRRVLLGLVVVLVGAGCSDSPVETSRQEQPQASLVGDNPHFSFLQPIAENTGTGEFHAGLLPVVEVCELSGGICGALLVRIATGATSGITVDVKKEMYQTSWALRGLVAGRTYELGVWSAASDRGGMLLGSVRFRAEAKGSGIAAVVDDGSTSGRSYSSTLPIKFRLERGVLCTTFASDVDLYGEPCLEQTIGPAGGTVVTADHQAGAYFPANAVSEDVQVVIERYEPTGAGDFCLPTYYPQYRGCYRYKTYPDLPAFNVPVTVGVCPDPSVFAEPGLFDQLDLYKWSEQEGDPIVFLPPENVDFLNCAGAPGGEVAPKPVRRVGWFSKALSPLAKLILPTPLSARGISPYGGRLSDFSRIGWLRPLTIQVISGDDQSARANTALPAPVVFQVSAAGAKVTALTPVAGIPVTLYVSEGSATAATPTTQADGTVSVTWTLGASAEQTLVASGWNFNGTFPNLNTEPWGSTSAHATRSGCNSTLALNGYCTDFLPGLEDGVDLGTEGSILTFSPTPRVKICGVAGCTTAGSVQNGDQYHYQADIDAGSYTIEVQLVIDGNPVTVGSLSRTFSSNGSLQVKFRVFAL